MEAYAEPGNVRRNIKTINRRDQETVMDGNWRGSELDGRSGRVVSGWSVTDASRTGIPEGIPNANL